MIGYIIVLIVLLTLFMLPVGIVAMVMSSVYNRKERELRDEGEAHRKILEGTYDRIWINIKQRAGIKEEFRRSFNVIYPGLLDNSMANEEFIDWILDCNPDFDPMEYVPMAESIAVDRERFVAHQKRMLALITEHRQLVSGVPAKWFIKNRSAIHYVPMDTDFARWGRSL
ncbi:MAG: hypothetical protein IJ745_04370 [Bacteroidales bacterium]|nr:hypothetical protein [Bacteroidales bacterium]